MIILIIIGIAFWRMAQAKELNAILWTVIAVASYFVAQLLAGFCIGLLNPYLLDNYGVVFVIGLSSGLFGVLLVWLAMNAAAKKNAEIKTDEFSDVLDDEYLEKL